MKSPVQTRLRLRDKRRRLLWVKVAAGSAVVLVSLVSIFFVSRLEQVIVTDVAIEGAVRADVSHIEATTRETLQGAYAFLIPKSNSLFVPQSLVSRNILSTFPEIETATVSRNGMTGLTITITERVAVALWCDSECYLMDSQGYIFSKGELTTLKRFQGVGEKIGMTYLNGFFPTLYDELLGIEKRIQRSVAVVHIDESKDVHVSLADGGEIRFVMMEKSDTVIDNIASVFASQRFKSGAKFEYADFRYGDKVYVKFVGE